MVILKTNKRDIVYFLFAFMISITFITCGIIQIVFKENPNLKESLEKSNISQVEFAFAMYGKHVPDNKLKIYNSMVSKDVQIDYSKDSFKNYAKNWLMGLIPSLILTVIFFIPYSSIKERIKRKNMIRKEELLEESYIKKYSLSGNLTKVKCIDGTISNKQIINKVLIYWSENNTIYLVNNDYHNDLGLFNIQFKDIICFSRYGDFYTSIDIKGGDSSFGMAALGYLIAGVAGAIIASRNSVSSKTVIHDERETLLFIRENDEEKYIFLEPKFYDFLMHILPNKEIGIMTNKENKYEKDNDKFEKIKKLGELKDKGYINESEFIKLKSELI